MTISFSLALVSAQFLRKCSPLALQLERLHRQGGVLLHLFVIPAAAGKPILRVQDSALAGVIARIVQLGGIAQEHHREFQSLGAVDGHHPHCIGAFPQCSGRGEIGTAFQHAVNKADKSVQAAPTVLPIPGGVLHQQAQIGAAILPHRQGGHDRGVIGILIDAGKQPVGRLARGQAAVARQRIHQRRALFIPLFGRATGAQVERLFAIGQPQARQIVWGEPEQLRQHHGRHRDIQQRVVDRPQQ